MDYLPKDATIEEACNWLQAKTGQTWVLARLLECHLTPHFWLDYKPGYPAIYGKQPLYFKDPVFQARASIPAPKATDRLRQVVEAGEGITI